MSVDFDVVEMRERIKLTVKSDPNSLCAISGIDKSVSFMGDRNSIQTDKVYRIHFK